MRHKELSERDKVSYFYKALAVYKNESAADIFRFIFAIQPYAPCDYAPDEYCDALYEAICDNICEAYKDLVPLVEPYVMQQRVWDSQLEEIAIDTTFMRAHQEKEKETVFWFQ